MTPRRSHSSLALLLSGALVLVACSHAPAVSATAAEAVRPEFAATPATDARIEACARGVAEPCSELLAAIVYAGRAEFLAQGSQAFASGCKAGVADACTASVLARVDRDRPEASLADLHKACAAGSPLGCLLEVPVSFESATSGDEMYELIEAARERCEDGAGATCSVVGNVYEQGMGAPRDEELAAALYQRGCEAKDASSCFQHGIRQAEDDEEASQAEARASYQLACTGFVGPACFNLAYQLFEGKGGAPDAPRARSLAWRACDLGDRTACDFLARSNEGRTFPPPEGSAAFEGPEQLEAIQRKYCAFGGGEACSGLAFSKGSAAEESQDFEALDEVIGLLQQGCDAGSARGCNVLGHVTRDAIRACEEGSELAQCLVAGFAHTRGTRLPPTAGESLAPDPQQAAAAFAKGCAGGQQSACGRDGRAAGP